MGPERRVWSTSVGEIDSLVQDSDDSVSAAARVWYDSLFEAAFCFKNWHQRDQAAARNLHAEDRLSAIAQDAILDKEHKQKQRVVTARHRRRHCETRLFEQCEKARTYPHTSSCMEFFHAKARSSSGIINI